MTINKPATLIQTEPTVGAPLLWAVRLLSARRVLNSRRVRARLELAGLLWDELAPVLGRIRSANDWVREWETASRTSAERQEWARASTQAFLAQVIVSPHAPEKAVLYVLMRDYHVRDRQEWGKANNISFTSHVLLGGKLAAYYEKPFPKKDELQKPTVLLLPPLASGKEELTPLVDALLLAGYPVLRVDMPAQGESPGPLFAHAESLLSRALDELQLPAVIAGGISLGAFWALRFAAHDKRVRGVLAVSPPAIVDEKQWNRQPPIIWQYLALYFGTTTRTETLACALALSLYEVSDAVHCPLLLFHARRDKIAQPDAPARYRAAFAHVPLQDHVLPDRHGCLLHLRNTIAPEFVRWCDVLTSGQEAAPVSPNGTGILEAPLPPNNGGF